MLARSPLELAANRGDGVHEDLPEVGVAQAQQHLQRVCSPACQTFRAMQCECGVCSFGERICVGTLHFVRSDIYVQRVLLHVKLAQQKQNIQNTGKGTIATNNQESQTGAHRFGGPPSLRLHGGAGAGALRRPLRTRRQNALSHSAHEHHGEREWTCTVWQGGGCEPK